MIHQDFWNQANETSSKFQRCVAALCLATSLPMMAAPAAESPKKSMPESVSGLWKNIRGSVLELYPLDFKMLPGDK
ncbi:hypothetical protein GZ78_02880 [Endozoicomonas numazuensis]|uniref:Uncharacterized protein n=1 Tax=Endozoicomonas numazuensis TaxID=1137799 RepID=A0A081NKM8_9GAMM|nr:hypothetical protein GZ78_02880 [Endozoicomonas numazuensis]